MSTAEFSISAKLVDVVGRSISPARITVRNGVIADVQPIRESECEHFIMPGFVDAHIHIESSMLLPSQFARAAVVHGTLATVSDPHEIANVCGLEGIEMMLRDAAQSPFKFHFGAPACVPATFFETAGAELDAATVEQLLDDPRIGYLSEMMDFPGVLAGNDSIRRKIAAAINRNKPVDGHAPGLRGHQASKYFASGISTDHECVSLDEALDKIAAGALIAIREGSAARNFEALRPLIDSHPDHCMFCSDDKHPDELLLGHINQMAARAIEAGADLMNVLRICSVNAIRHYGLDVGLLRPGDAADFVIVSSLKDFSVLQTFIDGNCVADNGQSRLPDTRVEIVNRFHASPIESDALRIKARADRIRVIEALDGQLITNSKIEDANIVDGMLVADPQRDLLKLVVVNRYRNAKPSMAMVSGFGLKRGAIASTVAHDSHNVVAVGVDDDDLANAINAVVEIKGGLAVADGDRIEVLPLPVGGLMATGSCEEVGSRYSLLDRRAKELGSTLRSPFMTLSFMTLLVIPSLKLSNKGLFDVEKFEFADMFVVPE